MGAICKNCGYERTVADTNPEWQCPSCGAAYSKVNKPVSRPGKSGRTGRYTILIMAIIVTALGTDIYLTQKAEREKADQLRAIEALAEEWDSANRLAQSTSRIALAGPVSKLQAIQQELSNLPADKPCVADSQLLLSGYMSLIVEGYLRFMKGENESSSIFLEEARSSLSKYKSKLESCSS